MITGKQSQGMWDFVLKVLRFTFQVQSYVLLMTDTYPPFRLDMGGSEPEAHS